MAQLSPVWPPDAALAQKSQLAHFMRLTATHDFAALHRRSIEDPTGLLEQILAFLRIKFQTPLERARVTRIGLKDSGWLTGGTVNAVRLITENAPASQIALTWENARGESRAWSYRAFAAVGRRAAGLFAGVAEPVEIPQLLTLETVALLAGAARVGRRATQLESASFAALDASDLQPHTEPPVALPPEAPLLDARTHGAFIVKAAIDLAFCANVSRATRLAWYGSDPWMLLGALALGATVVLFDPADLADPERLWSLCAHQNIEVLGLTPELASNLPEKPGDRHTLDRLETVVIDGVLEAGSYENLRKVNAGHMAVLQYDRGVCADNLLCPVEPGRIGTGCLFAAEIPLLP